MHFQNKKEYNETMMNNTKKSEKEIGKIKASQLKPESFKELSDFFSLFADQTRLSLIALLSGNELCVNDIAEIMGISQSRVSHQLQVLRKHDIVTYYRDGKQVLYTLTDNHIKDLFRTGLEHTSEKNESLYQDKKEKGW